MQTDWLASERIVEYPTQAGLEFSSSITLEPAELWPVLIVHTYKAQLHVVTQVHFHILFMCCGECNIIYIHVRVCKCGEGDLSLVCVPNMPTALINALLPLTVDCGLTKETPRWSFV